MQARKHISIFAAFNLREFEKSSQRMQRQMRAAASRLTSIGQNLTVGLTAPIAAGFTGAINEFSKFEYAMKNLEAVTPDLQANPENLEILTKLAKDLGISTRFTAVEIGNLMVNYSKLGMSAYDIQEITESTLMLANATGSDLAEAAIVAGGTMKGFQLEAEEMERVTNVMAMAFTNSALDLEKWKVSVSKVAPIASSLGISIEEVAAMFGILADSGIEASIIGTSMRKIFQDLADSGMSYEEAMARITAAGEGMLETQVELDKQVISNAKGMNQVSEASNLFQVRAAATALTLNNFTDKIAENTKKFGEWNDINGEGLTALQNMNDIIDKSMIVSFAKLKSAITGVGIEFGEVLAPIVRGLAKVIATAAIKFSVLNDMTKKIILVTAGLTALFGPLIVAIGLAATAMTGFATATGIALAPAYAVVALILLMVATYTAAYLYFKNNKDALGVLFRNIFKKVANAVKNAAVSILNSLAEMADAAGLDGFRDSLAKTSNEIFQTLSDFEKPIAFKGFGFEDGAAKKEIEKIKQFGKRASKEVSKALGFDLDNLGGDDDKDEKLKKYKKEVDAWYNELEKSHNEAMDGVKMRMSERAKDLFNITILGVTGLKFTAQKDLNKSATAMEQQATEIYNNLEKLTIKVESKVNDFTQRVNDMIRNMAQDAVYGIADMFGQMMNSPDFTKKDFGKGMLAMVGGFMQQLGGLMITFALSFDAFSKSITLGPAGVAIALAAGVAMVAAGSSIKNAMSKGLNGGGSSSVSTPSSYGSASTGVSYSDQDMVSTVRIEGREMIITQKRENNFRR